MKYQAVQNTVEAVADYKVELTGVDETAFSCFHEAVLNDAEGFTCYCSDFHLASDLIVIKSNGR